VVESATLKLKFLSMKISIILCILLLVLVNVSCDYIYKRDDNIYQINAGRTTYNKNVSDTLVIKEPCAVVFRPDSLKLKKLKNESTPDEYDIIIDDAMYYLNQSSIFLNEKDVKLVDTESNKVIFIKENKEYLFINLDSLYWGIILFDGKQNPKIVEMTNIEEEYNGYFKFQSK